MTRPFVLILILFISSSSFSQEIKERDYMSIEEARVNHPDSVFAIRMIKMKLTDFPEEILNYPNLRALDLTKNKLTKIPQNLNQLQKLEILTLSKNRLQIFPIVICSMPNLKSISLSNNIITNMPTCIQYLTQLEHLDIFNTQIDSFPSELALLKNLKTFDARGILFGREFQQTLEERLSNTKIKFDAPCNCIE